MKGYRPCSFLDGTPYHIWIYEEEILSIQAKRKSPSAIKPFSYCFPSGSPSPPLPQLPPHFPSSRNSTIPTTVSSLMLVVLHATSSILANTNLASLAPDVITSCHQPNSTKWMRSCCHCSMAAYEAGMPCNIFANLGDVTGVPHRLFLAGSQMNPDLQIRITWRTFPCSLHASGQHGAHSSESSLSGFNVQVQHTLCDLRERYLLLQALTSVNLLLGVKTGPTDNLVVANEPVPRASTSSPPGSSSDSSPSLPLRRSSTFSSFILQEATEDIRGLEPVPPSVNP
ncbi:hypothetical protein DL96DRAFT_558160 [Flagelloscypha sp. PMI_526]|nr:hypothetical protein DL96DRAFT_558160 [Flagelloscypha sp. PMI_526]